MYLKEIRAQGFKSFANKTIIELSDNITGVVGPNGSGKSNVVDAVRWVLGEQSVKQLRGTDNMADVIFSGSKSRNPMNIASVTLVFDNKDRYLNIAFDEVAIKRRVYRDGTNEYYINNEKCRLKDITDIMIDTGIAKESFNIISQGKIEEILSSKPNERRVIFEEAAGVLKYKKRKEEALRKLDKTHDNMDRVNDIIGELRDRVEPLRVQKEKAIEYLDIKKNLEFNEVALIASDITKINDDYSNKKEQIKVLEKEVLNLNVNNSSSEAKLSDLKNKLDDISNNINLKNKELLEKTALVEKINGEKNIILERQKFKVEDSRLRNSLIENKEKLLSTENAVNVLKNEINEKQIIYKEIINKYKIEDYKINSLKDKKRSIDNTLNNEYRKNHNLKVKIDTLKDSIDSNSLLSNSVKSVLNNPKLKGIHNIIGNIIEIEEKYVTAINIALASAGQFIIVDNELCAKEAINFLKTNSLGRATFFPLNVIKGRSIDIHAQDLISSNNSCLGIASNLVKCDNKYREIINNQLGNVIVVDNIDNANYIGKLLNYRYKIVTLDGQLCNVGGSLTGGQVKTTKNNLSLKYELEGIIRDYNKSLDSVKNLEDDINCIDNDIKSIEDKLYLINKDKIDINEEINTKKDSILRLNGDIDYLNNEIKNINSMIDNSLTDREEEIINRYYEEVKNKDDIVAIIKEYNNKADSIRDEILEFEHSMKKENSLYNLKSKDLNNLQIDVNRMDVKLDNLLNILSETYNLTYEKASHDYILDESQDSARIKVNNLKRRIKEIGMVNIDAIEEFDKVNERYEFLNNQMNDLKDAENILLDIINQMDEVMKDEFIKTFNVIKDNFKSTFIELFKGGNAELKLTDPNNILETGVEIVASPPGKKLTTINLLSGGEKTFTAISLLFAILKSRPVPFCILDEVEAALDDANVNSFGLYLKSLQQKTQFILITHKKRTMEFVDNLYGITMQESGVSKLVSVKLADAPTN